MAQPSKIEISGEPVDLSACEREPIHIPGSVQPHGVLVSLLEPELRIVQASESTAAWLDVDARALVGTPVKALLDADSAAWLGRAVRRPSLRAVTPAQIKVAGRPFETVLHRSEGLVVLELEQALHDEEQASGCIEDVLERLQCARSLSELFELSVRDMKRLSGYDRVMVYRFHDDGHGEVVAEAREPEMEPYLHLHYPASDIPPQARRLYASNCIRLIRDIEYRPSPIHPPNNPLTGRPLDLSYAMLRSVSPVHVEYLRNMGVRASLTISLFCEGQLYGLIACHHRTPHLVSYYRRGICDLVGRVVSLQIELRTRHEQAEQRLHAVQVTGSAVEQMTSAGAQRPLVDNISTLFGLVDATGVAVVDGEIAVEGKTPKAEDITAITEWMRTNIRSPVFATDCLAEHLPWAASLAPVASGLLAVALAPELGTFLLWFRAELLRTVRWGGDPNVPATVDPRTLRLCPRTSFAIWQQTVRGRSHPWQSWEVATAGEMRGAMVGLVIRRAAELSRLNAELSAAVRARDEFLSMASHELRTPIATLKLTMQSVLRMAQKAPERFSYEWAVPRLETAMRQVERTGQLIDYLLDISRIRSGRLTLEIEDVDLGEVVRRVAERFADPLAVSGSTLSISIGTDMVGRWDAARLDQVLTNLLANAIKYGAGNPIEIEAARQGSHVYLSVRDHGIGIAPEEQERIFERFERAVGTIHYGGFGLGLWIVRQFIEQMGGHVTVQSAVGQGATFTVELPLAAEVRSGGVQNV
ncbi:ATP-binding protein [Polyangium aurulentum]|uniref:ATP-binding protein n=1 Tax=Polyangium aurulentum TaxID=2567896 RepID=UPI00146B6A29|nr:ATP-binding protein [Polyangium aurulentum]UQA56680.1 GAF domain-containing protein [Polyangium aurulentum]